MENIIKLYGYFGKRYIYVAAKKRAKEYLIAFKSGAYEDGYAQILPNFI